MNLLLALDIHDDDHATLLHDAVRWARRLGTGLDVVYVDEYSSQTTFLTDPVLLAHRDEVTRVHDDKLGAVMSSIPEDVRGVGLLRPGLAQDEIATAAEGRPALLIGTHGRRALERVAWGSVAERVVRTAPCPVIVLRPPLDQDGIPNEWRVLLAVDIHEEEVETVVSKGAAWAASPARSPSTRSLTTSTSSSDSGSCPRRSFGGARNAAASGCASRSNSSSKGRSRRSSRRSR